VNVNDQIPAEQFVEDLFDTMDADVEAAPRPPHPDSVRWLENGAVPKPKDIKAKTISSLDVPLGGVAGHDRPGGVLRPPAA